MSVRFEPAPAELSAEYIHLRSRTRENAISAERLRSLGITAQSWASDIRSGELVGFVAMLEDEVGAYCFGNTRSGEVVVLAVLPELEGRGVGRELLARVVSALRQQGHRRLFLGTSSDAQVRSHGFYRRLGWRSTGTVDARGDEILERVFDDDPSAEAGTP